MIQLHLVLSKDGEGFPKIIDVCSSNFSLDKYVIYVHLHIPPNLVFEKFIYQALIGSTYIF